jgi:PAS domain S-box-containing protein
MVISEPIIGKISQKWIWLMARRLQNPDNSFAGVVYGAIFIDDIVQMFNDVKLAPGSAISLRDENMGLVARTTFDGKQAIQVGDKRLSPALENALKSSRLHGTYDSGNGAFDGVRRIYSYHLNQKYGFTVLVGIPVEVVLSEWYNQAFSILVLLIFFVVGTFVFSRSTLRTRELHKRNLKELIDTQFALEKAGIAIHWVDVHTGDFLYVNDRAAEMLGYTVDEMLQLRVADLDQNFPQGDFRQITEKMFASGTAHFESTLKSKDGRLIHVDLVGYLSPKQDGYPSRYITFLTDISQRKLQEQAILEARDAAESANIAKSLFLANMSHEIRTPINAVLGFAHLCLRQSLSPREREYLVKIQNASQSLLGIVNDILDYSKVDAGMLQLESITFSLDEVLSGVASLFDRQVREKGLELVVGTSRSGMLCSSCNHKTDCTKFAAPSDKSEVSLFSESFTDVPDRLIGDPLRLGQVLVNLLGNAVKFTDRGEVILSVEPVSVSADSVTLLFAVRDTGLGLTFDQQKRLFKAFTQADNSTTRKYGGTGLGLALSKQLVTCMGGEIGVESEAGVGSCFSFTACFGVAVQNNSSSEQTPLYGKKILVVDDNAFMRNLLSNLINTFGCQVQMVDSGMAALACIEDGNTFDIILMDWRMPDMDGLSTALKLKNIGDATPVMLVTGDESELARIEADLLGINIARFLNKPVSSAALLDAMVRVLDGTTTKQPQPVTPAPIHDLTGAHILLVDDNQFNREVGLELIEITGATVTTAEDGEQAVAAVANGSFDLVLMDIQMPVMDGYTAARIIRERWPNLPIIALTAHAMAEERARVLAGGMNDIVTKPIIPDTLYAVLASYLGGVSLGKSEGIAKSDMSLVTPAETLVTTEKNQFVTHDTFDLDAALARVNGSQSMLTRFLRLFRERNAGFLENMDAALGAQDFETVRRLAHTLKGGAGTVGLIELQNAAGNLENALEYLLRGNEGASYHAEFVTLETSWERAQLVLASMLDTDSAI